MAISWIELFTIFHVDETIKLVNGGLEFSVVDFPFLLEGQKASLCGFFLTDLLLFGRIFSLNNLLVVIKDVGELNGAILLLMRFLVVVFAVMMMLLHLGHFVNTTNSDTVTLVIGRAIYVILTIELVICGPEGGFFLFSNVSSHMWVIV